MAFLRSLIKLVGKKRGWKCQRCGRRFSEGYRLEAHHKIPSSLGGADTEENMEILCLPCHALRHREIEANGRISAQLIEKRIRTRGEKFE